MSKARLFHGTTPELAEEILLHGFRDYTTPNLWQGVWLSNCPLDSQGAEESVLLEVVVDVSVEELFYQFEVLEYGKPYREVVLPSRVLNDPEKCTIHLLTETEVAEAELGPFWNEYPIGEPHATWTDLFVEEK